MKEKRLILASVIAAAFSTLCCIGPLLAVGAGLGTFTAASFFESVRPYLLALTAAFMAAAVYLTYRKNTVGEGADDSCAVLPAAARRRRGLLWLSVVAVAMLATLPYYAGLDGMTGRHTPAAGAGEPVFMSLAGMTCDACALGAKAYLEREEGVVQAEIDYESATAVIYFDASRTSVEKLVAAIEKLGYAARLQEPRS